MKLLSLPALLLALLLFPSFSGQHPTPKSSVVQYVNPFIGTGGHGHTYPGAVVPFGMVQLSPDTRLTGWDGCSGYHASDSVVFGFTHTHLSGTGCLDYGDLLLMPTTGPARLNNGANGQPGYASRFLKSKEKAEPGYYRTVLEDYGVEAELTTTTRTGMHRYTYPAGKDNANLVIDLKHRDEVLRADLKNVSATEIEGYRVSRAWAKEQHLYFVIQFSKPLRETNRDSSGLVRAYRVENGGGVLIARVGISAVSIEGARNNLKSELQHWDFDRVRSEARALWEKALGKIEVEGGTDEQKTVFYTALYHTMVVPNVFQDADHRYRGMDNKIYHARDHTQYTVFSLWDTYRGCNPLYTILEPGRTNDFINSFLKLYETGGNLPVWELSANETWCMIGNHAIPVIADAYMKGIRNYDAGKLLNAMIRSVNNDRAGYPQYADQGYLTMEDEAESVSRTLEYGYDDWCIATMARAMGKKDVYDTYIRRAQAYRHLFDPATRFMRGRTNNTWFAPFDPYEVNINYTEANAWQYSFYVPHDVSGFAALSGGKEALRQRLDSLFTASTRTTGREQSDISGLIGQYAHGNEPSHHMVYLYNYLNQPWKTQQQVRFILDNFYKNNPDGLIGNEDCGQMSAWYVLSAMGFYPVCPGDNHYAIGTPIFPKVSLHLDNGRTFTIQARNVSQTNYYVQSAQLNGKPYTKSYLTHNDIVNGGTLTFDMAANPNREWGSGEGDAPVSAIDAPAIVPAPFVSGGNKIFRDKTEVTLGSGDPAMRIHYTLDGTTPTLQSPRYSGPLVLDQTTTVRFMAEKPGSGQSRVFAAVFTKVTEERKVSLMYQPAPAYSFGGAASLVDMQYCGKDFRVPGWLGFSGNDLDATVDLGKAKNLKKIALHCIQDAGSWIVLPPKVSFFISMDNVDYEPVGTVLSDVPPFEQGHVLKEFSVQLNKQARYVRVIAKNYGPLPAATYGENAKAWLFADEIVTE